MIIGSILGTLIAWIAFIMAAPLDILALKIKKERLANQNGLMGRLIRKGDSLKKGLSIASAKGKANVGKGKTPKKDDKKKDDKKKADKEKSNDLNENKDEDSLENKIQHKKEQIKLLVKEKTLHGTAALIRLIGQILGAWIQTLIATFEIFIIVGIIIVLIVGYIYSYINMNTVVTPATATTPERRTYVSSEDSDTSKSGGFWSTFFASRGVIFGESTGGDSGGAVTDPNDPNAPTAPENPSAPETPSEPGVIEPVEEWEPPAAAGTFVGTSINVLDSYATKPIKYTLGGGGIIGNSSLSDCSHYVRDVLSTFYGRTIDYRTSSTWFNSTGTFEGFKKVEGVYGTLAQLDAQGLLRAGDICACNGHVNICYNPTGDINTTTFSDFGLTIYVPRLKNKDARTYCIWRLVE